MQTITPLRRWLALIGVSLLAFTAFLDYTIVNSALPFIKAALKTADVLQFQWINSAYAMMMAMLMVAMGRFGDRLGKRWVYYLGASVFLIGTLLGSLAQSIDSLILGRIFQGIGAAAIFTMSVSLLAEIFPKEALPKAVGFYSAVTGAGLAVGPFLSGVLVSVFDWHAVFWINIPIVLAGLLLCLVSLANIPKSALDETPIDWLGLCLLVIGLGALMYGLVNGGELGWQHWHSIGALSLGLFSLVVLVFWSRLAKHPLIDVTVFSDTSVKLAALICIAAGLISLTLMFYDALYLSDVWHYSALTIGLFIFAMPCVQVLISFQFHRIMRVISVRILIILGLFAGLLAGIGHVLMAFEVSTTLVFIVLILMGFAWGVANVGSVTALNQSIKPEKLGSAIGVVFTSWNLFGAVSLALASVIFHLAEAGYHAASNPTQAFLAGFGAMSYLALGILGLLLVAGVWLFKRHQRATFERQ